MKFGAYAGASFLFASTAVIHAWRTRVDFYPTVVFITTNKLAQVAIGNWALVMALAFGKLVRKIFLGPLRDIEVEVMYENARYAITETCLALTVFRGDLTAVTIALFTQLLFVKAFHWLAQARVEHLEQTGGQSLTSMTRLSCLLVLNVTVDGAMVNYCLEQITTDEPTVLVLFAFEYAILSIAAFASVVHIILHVIDSRMTGAWHGKATWTMLLEFFSEVFKFSFYMIFFLVMFTLYSVPPIHLVRDIYMSFDQLQRRLQAFYRYRRLAATMDERFPAATEEELAECEHTCIICRDAMHVGKKLPCSHIFHFQCLRLWLQQQQACPTCRTNIPAHGTAAATTAAAEQRAAAGAGVGAGAAPLAQAVQQLGVLGGGDNPIAVAGLGGPGDNGAAAFGPRDGQDEPAAGAATAAATAAASGGGASFSASAGTPSSVAGGAVVGGQASGSSSEGFAGLLAGGGGGGGMLPAGLPLHAVIVNAPDGTPVRMAVERDAPVAYTESQGAVLLLMGTPSSCGSFPVFGGWVGGPGREEDIRLVDISQPAFGQSRSRGPGETDEEEKEPAVGAAVEEMLDGPDAPRSVGVENDGGSGLRRRAAAGHEHAGGQA